MELTPEEIAEQEKKERIEGYKCRLCNLHDIHGLALKCGWSETNPMKRVMDLIEQDDESELLLLESKVDELRAEADQQEADRQAELTEKEEARNYISNINLETATQNELNECIRCLVKLMR